MAEFRMPSLGADMETGRLVRWFVKPGDTVKRGDIIAEVETQKGVIDVEVFESGVVQVMLVAEGTEVAVGAPLALIASPGEEQTTPAEAPAPAVTVTAAAPTTVIGQPLVTLPAPSGDGRARASPAARRLAEEMGVDLRALSGTGPDGAITREDVQRAAAAAPPTAQPAPAADEPDRLVAMRAAIATSMARSKRDIPHYYLSLDIDLGPAMSWLREANTTRPVEGRLLPAALLLRATALAVASVPEVNGYWVDGAFRPSATVNLGVAISLRGGGLVAPAIIGAEQFGVDALMAALSDLVARARTGKLRSSEVTDATITVTNLGDRSASAVFGVIYPPQVALVGFGSITERPWVTDGALLIRPVVTVSLSADHRASVGHRGGLFLARLGELLQKPNEL